MSGPLNIGKRDLTLGRREGNRSRFRIGNILKGFTRMGVIIASESFEKLGFF